MIKKFSIFNFQFSIKFLLAISVIVCTFYILHFTFYVAPTFAQTCPNQTTNPRVQGGLISTPAISGKFGNPGATCVVDPKAAFVPYKLPSFDTLKALYYTQSKMTKNTSLSASFTTDGIYSLSTDLNINSPGQLSGNGTEVIFIGSGASPANLNINQNVVYHTSDGSGGLVFVVSGNVNIDSGVTQIDAVIIAGGTIYTAGAGCNASSVMVISPLTVNGSLISLSSNPIMFCRALSDNSQAAEKINQQPKYLVLLRNMFADTLQKWSEIQ